MSRAVKLLDPVEFLQPNRRLFIDTNIFMDTDPRRSGGLKRLFERGQDAIVKNSNPIVVPTKVVGELTKQSRLDPSRESGERAEAIKKAAAALAFLESASQVGLVRKDLGDNTNPYADDLFLGLFERFAGTYEMCLLTHDITLKLRIRLLAHRLGRRLLVGVLTKDGDLEVDSDQALFDRGLRKYARHGMHIAEGRGTLKDESEVAALKPLLDDFKNAFGLAESDVKLGGRVARQATAGRKPATAATPKPFTATSKIKPRDTALTFTSLPKEGDPVKWESASKSGSFTLGALLGEGGEGAVYEGSGNTVVKIFDKDHITQHRKAKIELLVRSGLQAEGICIPSATVHNAAGEFVGYIMPKASGHEFQRAIFNKRKFEKEFPNWKKADLVDICISFLEKVQYLHSLNIVLGDINPKNLMVDEKKNVFIIDADSWQVEGYPCPVGTPMFTSPAMLGKSYAEDLRTMEDELFAVATMLFMIVMTGQFPYIRTGTDGDMVQLIKEGNFAFQISIRGKEYNDRNQPEGDWKYMWSHIHKPIKDLFWDTFHKEGKRYKKRPTADEWLTAFKAYKAYLGNKQLNFDPMSNEVRPVRNRAYRPDTPIKDCPNCGRKNAIAGIWREDDMEYFVPQTCVRCKDLCKDCGTRSESLKAGRCPSCDHKYRYGYCVGCGREVLKKYLNDGRCSECRLFACKSCNAWTKKSELQYGKCESCRRWEDELDYSRLCGRCGRPFLTNGQVRFFQQKGLTVQKRHKEGTYGCG